MYCMRQIYALKSYHKKIILNIFYVFYGSVTKGSIIASRVSGSLESSVWMS